MVNEETYYTVIKHSEHLRSLQKCGKHKLQSSVFYISLVFSNAPRVLSQCNTRVSFIFQSAISDSPGMSKALMEQKQKERKFLEQLLDGKKVENYTIPVPVNAELRKYQQVCESPNMNTCCHASP